MGGEKSGVIHLDANYLILGANRSGAEGANLLRWAGAGEAFGTSSVAWIEFATGPATPAVVDFMLQLLEERVVPVGRDEAELAAILFNDVGRKRSARYDCMIAATAIRSGSRLATTHLASFRSFAARGLALA
jgi:predicted nucleic acid-binding protein